MALYDGYFDRAHIAAETRKRGCLIHVRNRNKWKRDLLPVIEESRNIIQEIASSFSRQWGPKEDNPVFNPQSLTHLRQLLFDCLGARAYQYTAKKKEPKLDKQTIQAFCANRDESISSVARELLRYRKANKLYSTYIKHLTKRIYPEGKVWGTKGGRWSYQNPNMQNIPKKLRNIITAEQGAYIIEADYSQLEMRIAALLSGDETLLYWYNNNIDAHVETAKGLFNTDKPSDTQRQIAKTYNYAEAYGADESTIWADLVVRFKDLTITDVHNMKVAKAKMHPGLMRWRKELIKTGIREGYTECPVSKRRQYFHGQPEITKILNYPIQGTGADIIDAAIPHVYKALRRCKNSHFLFQVHDALVCEVDRSEVVRVCKILDKWMSKPVKVGDARCSFPVDFKIGKTWGTGKEYTLQQLEEREWV
jgi:DNA polymerase I-like protein with 3'-5' exonuclease and polymerase domains